jgi:hypothetical protein
MFTHISLKPGTNGRLDRTNGHLGPKMAVTDSILTKHSQYTAVMTREMAIFME